MVLLGPSGCGKTTTLRLVAGLEKPTSGNIYFDNKPLTDVPARNRNVSMVFQSYALFPHMSVFDNIAFPLKVMKRPKGEIKERVSKIAELLKIGGLLGRKPSQLSGGQQQRVALARAVIKGVDVMLLDEPLSNLDARLRVAMRIEIKKLQKRFKTTTIYVTHDQIEAMSMADRIVVMNDGGIQQVGSSDELYSQPKTLFVASFIGSPPMNLIDCSFKEGDLDLEGFTLKVPPHIGEALKDHPELIVGLRPRHLRLFKKGKKGSVEAKVYGVEPLGEETNVILDAQGVILRSVAPPTFSVDVGEKVWVSFDMSKIHFFDRKTENAII